MRAKCFVTVMGKMLSIEPEGKEWSITIRQENDTSRIKRNISFYEFHGKDNITKEQIENLVPNFRELVWLELDNEPFWTELTAVDNGYRINLIRHNSSLTKSDMLKEFLTLIG
jgi:hypothetical protein